MTKDEAPTVGVVVIGRNEGARLKRCLTSLLSQGAGPIVYVDSGSTDESVQMARSRGIEVVELDTTIPFTMARGRNAGFWRLSELKPQPELVQFVDGDCEVDGSWLARAVDFLRSNRDVSCVCGFRRERFPDASVYNRIVDMEWRGPIGEIAACGGDALYRLEAFRATGGFNEGMIAGEEAELCARLRRQGGKVWRLDCSMTVHDAAMHHFGQWWKRCKRTGHAYAEGSVLSGSYRQRKQWMSALVYGALIPAGLVTFAIVPVAAPLRAGAALCGLAAYLKSARGSFNARRALHDSIADSAMYAAFCLVAKVPEAQGVSTFWANYARGRRSTLIEYKA